MVSIAHSRKFTNKKLSPPGILVWPLRRDLLNLHRDRVICWRSSNLFTMRGMKSPGPTVTRTRGSWVRSKSTGRSKSNRRLLPRNSAWFNLAGNSRWKTWCASQQSAPVSTERAIPRSRSNESIDKFGVSPHPRGSSITGCHLPRIAFSLFSDPLHAGKGQGRGSLCSLPTLPISPRLASWN